MTEEISFDSALERLKEIANIVQDKEMDIEKSLDFLEEGIKLANFCTKKIETTYLQN